MGLVASAAMAAAADSQGTLGRASIDGFRTAMLAIAPADVVSSWLRVVGLVFETLQVLLKGWLLIWAGGC